MGLHLLMAVRDPTLVEQFDISRSDQAGSCPARSKGAQYTENQFGRKVRSWITVAIGILPISQETN
jgi:hypothetical protein